MSNLNSPNEISEFVYNNILPSSLQNFTAHVNQKFLSHVNKEKDSEDSKAIHDHG